MMVTNNDINVFPPNRNLIIGGDLSVNPWQLGTSFNFTVIGETADMFSYGITGVAGVGRVITSKVADSPTVAQSGVLSSHCLSTEVTTNDATMGATDQYLIVYGMEGYDWAKLAQRTITASFWVKSSVTGTYCVSMINIGLDRSIVMEYTISAANTWEYKVIQLPPSPVAGTWNFANGTGIRFRWCLGGGSGSQITPGSWQTAAASNSVSQVNFMATIGNTFKINLFQLEAGITATPFEEISYAKTLMKCQRYTSKTYNIGTDPGAITTAGMMAGFKPLATGEMSTCFSRQKTTMRTIPTIVWYNPVTGVSGSMRNFTSNTDHSVASTFLPNESSAGFPSITGGTIHELFGGHYLATARL